MQIPRKMPVWALTAVAVFLLAMPSWGADPSRQLCYQVKLKEPPRWVSGALWREESSQLIVVDPAQNKISAYNRAGEPVVLADLRVTDQEEFQPTAMARTGEAGFLLELADGTLVRLDKELRFTGESVVSKQTETATGLRIGSLYQWKVAGNYLIAYGALVNDKDQIIKGFFRVPLAVKAPPEMLTPLQESDFYLIGNSYIATIGDTAYYVAMGKSPAIYKVPPEGKPQRLKAFPGDLRTRPNFKTKMTGPNSAAPHFAELETFTVASGLYSQDGMLFLLARAPGRRPGQTVWRLYKIDPKEDRLLTPAGIKLPTSANHLTVAPSKSEWFLIERGPVRERQQQVINNMVVVDSSAIRGAARLPSSCPAK